MTEVSAGPPPEVDSQDPLPEAQWFWRRVFIFALTTVAVIGCFVLINHIAILARTDTGGIEALTKISGWILLLLWFVVTYYLIAPSAEQVTRIVQTAGLLKSGIGFSSEKKAVAPDGSAAVARTEVAPVVGPGDVTKRAVDVPETTGLPGDANDYSGPPLGDIPPPDPSTPEETPWQR